MDITVSVKQSKQAVWTTVYILPGRSTMAWFHGSKTVVWNPPGGYGRGKGGKTRNKKKTLLHTLFWHHCTVHVPWACGSLYIVLMLLKVMQPSGSRNQSWGTLLYAGFCYSQPISCSMKVVEGSLIILSLNLLINTMQVWLLITCFIFDSTKWLSLVTRCPHFYQLGAGWFTSVFYFISSFF